MIVYRNDLLKQEPAKILDWLKEVQSGSQQVDEDVNWWLGLAEMAAYSATTEVNVQDRLLWAQVVNSVQEYTANKANPAASNPHEVSAKLLAVRLIDELGPVVGHPILDPNLIEEWFFKGLTMSYEEAVSKAKNWRERPVEEIAQLRNLKNRLLPVEQLKEKGYLADNSELSKWLHIRNNLP